MYIFPRIRTIVFVMYYYHYYLFSVDYADSRCTEGCALALASYSISLSGDLDSYISNIAYIFSNISIPEFRSYNPSILNAIGNLDGKYRVNVPFSCDCLNNGDYLGHVFTYPVYSGCTYDYVASEYSNLITGEWLSRINNYPEMTALNVIVNCSCGNEHVSKDYSLFLTYPMFPGENLTSIALATKTSSKLVQMYNPGVNFSAGTGLLYIPTRGDYPSYLFCSTTF